MLVGLCGSAGAGKDTVRAILVRTTDSPAWRLTTRCVASPAVQGGEG